MNPYEIKIIKAARKIWAWGLLLTLANIPYESRDPMDPISEKRGPSINPNSTTQVFRKSLKSENATQGKCSRRQKAARLICDGIGII